MVPRAIAGLAAAAAGTAAINLTTYLDMAVRGRASSEMPAKLVKRMEDAAGVSLGADEGPSSSGRNRREAVGALLGYANGLAVGVVFGLLRPAMKQVPAPVAGIGLGFVSMAATDVPAIASGVTDPRSWGASGWLLDAGSHAVYGIVTAVAYDALNS